MSAIANSFLSAASVCAFPAARGTRRSAPHRAAPVFVRASADDDAIADRSPLAQLGAASKKLGIGILAAAVVATPAANAMPEEVISDLASLAANPVQNARALLRNALPIDNKQIREVQRKIESISDDLRVPGVRFTGVESSVNGASKIVNNDAAKILAAVSPDKLDDGKAALKELQDELEAFKVVVAQKDKQEVPLSQQRVLQLVGRIEEDMVKGFPFEVPPPYDTAPLLKGRATVEMEVKVRDNPNVDVGRALCAMHLDGLSSFVRSELVHTTHFHQIYYSATQTSSNFPFPVRLHATTSDNSILDSNPDVDVGPIVRKKRRRIVVRDSQNENEFVSTIASIPEWTNEHLYSWLQQESKATAF